MQTASIQRPSSAPSIFFKKKHKQTHVREHSKLQNAVPKSAAVKKKKKNGLHQSYSSWKAAGSLTSQMKPPV